MSATVEHVGEKFVVIIERDGMEKRKSFSSKAEAEEFAGAIANAESILKQNEAMGDWEI